ncbi:hypothetical protein LCGC14_1352560 [marine sediment metagenome]|uniref:Uncharacterized protein n=1 Tax=marine sediment metagenome TaxID=412755 RepID=A0A0F9KAG4_9ZZZZ
MFTYSMHVDDILCYYKGSYIGTAWRWAIDARHPEHSTEWKIDLVSYCMECGWL